MRATLYQTLEDRDNPEEVENNGPFPCHNNKAWLGKGYYFWDTYIQLGHVWGETVYSDGYIICKASAIIDSTCWDLHGNGEHLQQFSELCNEIVDKGIAKRSNITVAYVIQYLKNLGVFIYKAIRARGVNSFTKGLRSETVIFKHGNKSYMEILPQVQLCLLEKKALSLHNYHIVYPEMYIDPQYA